MNILDLIQYDHGLGQFVLKKGEVTRALNPWEELALIDRPSIFMQDVRFRARQPSGTISSEDGLGYKQFGVYTRAKERQPNKHEGVLEHATAKATRAATRKTDPNV